MHYPFESNTGSNVTTISVDYNTKATKPTEPTRNGYTFEATVVGTKLAKVNNPECVPPGSLYDEARIEKLDDDTYQVFSVAKMWQFDPAAIEIPIGSQVDFFLISKDVVHGLNIAGTNVNMMAVPGAVNKFSYTFRKKCIFTVVCNEYCGSQHQAMVGQVVVK
ncbi:hypothetical protein CHS0354_000717 [Potamilus streckersoni]|uniref:Cytochrome oxidase subunit II copper A binding domain-containing protein n=1 Tax=Potamilus streckersoni TaxID=2493646 RepID=A0AAE0T7G3_9BIVA|nr:hypothetical protein CHS0354_000717 [Potamilus streckersoni]